jgi:hypothetical protein
MSEVRRGQCHCGKIAYEIDGDLTGVIHCHCSDCRRWHGHHSAYAVAMLEDFKFLRGEEQVQWYHSSDRARRGFCPHCGSTIFKDNKDGLKIVLSVGALDSPTGLKFLKNIFEESKGDYYELPGA